MRLIAQWADGSAVEGALSYALAATALAAVVVMSAVIIARLGRVQKRLEMLVGEKDRVVYENAALRRQLEALVGADGPDLSTGAVHRTEEGVLFASLGACGGNESFTTKSSSTVVPPYVAAARSPTNAPLMPGMRPDALDASRLTRGRTLPERPCLERLGRRDRRTLRPLAPPSV